MRRWLIAAGTVIVVPIVVLAYAFLNLNAIIAANRGYVVARASDLLGRQVAVAQIKVHVGWGLAIELRDVRITDDPGFAQLPFLEARDVVVKVRLLPLLIKSVRATRIRVIQPAVRVIRDRAGRFNLTTLGARGGTIALPGSASIANPSSSSGPQPRGRQIPTRGAPPAALTIASLSIEDGVLSYQDGQADGAPVTLNRLNLAVSDFRPDMPFKLKITAAALNDQPNLELRGEVGPLIRNDLLELDRVPLNLTAALGPFTLAQVRKLPPVGRLLPPDLTVSGPATIAAKVNGPVGALRLAASSDLSASRIIYSNLIDKAAGIQLQIKADAVRTADGIVISGAGLTLPGLNLTATDIAYSGDKVAARIDSDRADLEKLGKVLTIARDYHLSGAATVHANFAIAAQKPSAIGSVVLAGVNATPPTVSPPPVRDLGGTIKLSGNTATIGPLVGNVGSSHATVAAQVLSFSPLQLTYQAALDKVTPGEFVASRQQLGEQINQVTAGGNLSRDTGRLAVTTKVASPAGTLANVAYRNLALNGAYDANQLRIDSLRVAAFDGELTVSGSVTGAGIPSFDLEIGANDIDLQQALESQKAKAAATIRGRLTGTLQVYGAGAQFAQIRPTLRGTGRATLTRGKLVGVNVVAQTLDKVNNLPGIGALVPAEVVSRHPELFNSRDTAIDQASLTFTLQGQRLVSHDINARTADYTILGDGWFAMDKQLDLAARILLSPALSLELAGARRSVAYLENPDRQVEIPLHVSGQLPKPLVVPDAAILIQRAASSAVAGQLGRLIGGSSKADDGTPSKPKNPLDLLKGLFR